MSCLCRMTEEAEQGHLGADFRVSMLCDSHLYFVIICTKLLNGSHFKTFLHFLFSAKEKRLVSRVAGDSSEKSRTGGVKAQTLVCISLKEKSIVSK